MAAMSYRRRPPPTIIVRYWHETEPPWDRSGVPWIARIAVRWLIVITGFLFAEAIIRGIQIDGWEALLPAALVFVIARAVLRPLLIFLTCPLQLLTLGLFIFVVNATVLGLTAWISDGLGIGFHVDGFAAAFLGALVISAVSFILSRFFRLNPAGRRLKG